MTKRTTKTRGTKTGRVRGKGRGNVREIAKSPHAGDPFLSGMSISHLFPFGLGRPAPEPVKLLTPIPQKPTERCIYVIDCGPDPTCTVKFVDQNTAGGHEVTFEPKQLREMAADFYRMADILAPFETPSARSGLDAVEERRV